MTITTESVLADWHSDIQKVILGNLVEREEPIYCVETRNVKTSGSGYSLLIPSNYVAVVTKLRLVVVSFYHDNRRCFYGIESKSVLLEHIVGIIVSDENFGDRYSVSATAGEYLVKCYFQSLALASSFGKRLAQAIAGAHLVDLS